MDSSVISENCAAESDYGGLDVCDPQIEMEALFVLKWDKTEASENAALQPGITWYQALIII